MNEKALKYFNGDTLATTVWEKKYQYKDEKTPEDSQKRYVKEIGSMEAERIETIQDQESKLKELSNYGQNRYGWLLRRNNKLANQQYIDNFLGYQKIILGGSQLQGIGRHEFFSSLSNCLVLGQPFDSYSGIGEKSDQMVQAMKRRMGAGVDLSTIRPKNSVVHNQSGYSSGPVLFANRYSNNTLEVAQYGRRGALMLTIHINHPDALEFAEEKQDENKLTGANTSIILSDEFMEAVENKQPFYHRFPCTIPLENFKIELNELEENVFTICKYFDIDAGVIKTGYVSRINPVIAWNKIVSYAHKRAEPGLLFEGNWLKYGTDGVYIQYKPVTTNPCFAGDTLLLTDSGYFEIQSLVGQQVNVWNGKRWSAVTPEITNHNQEMLKITLSDGSSFRCTKYHNWPVWNNEQETMVQAKDLKEGTQLSKFNLPIVAGVIEEQHQYMYFKGFDREFVPDCLFSVASRMAWLSGLLDSDTDYEKDGIGEIHSESIEFLSDTKLMLTTLGIHSILYIDENKLCIDADTIYKLIDLGLTCLTFGSTKRVSVEQKNITVTSVVPDGIDKDVYCFSEPFDHKAVFNGFLVGQCSEIAMQEYDSCRLISVNLLPLVDAPYTEGNDFDATKAYEYFYEQITICDVVVDLESKYIERIINKINQSKDPDNLKQSEILLWQNILKQGQKGRRCGCGFTGFGDFIAALGLKYDGSEKTINTIRRLFEIKLIAELDASTDMAILYGTFDGFDFDLEFTFNDGTYSGNTNFYQTMIDIYPDGVLKMKKFGRRNVSWSTAAPTGSLSILAQTTSGIEPLFLPYYMRRKKCIDASERVDYIDPADGQKFTMFGVLHQPFKYWIEHHSKYANCDIKAEELTEQQLKKVFVESPWFGNCANDINWENRVSIQSLVQRYTTHSISSTINLPKDIDVDTVANIYWESWKKGLKGNTVYRDGSRGGVLISNDTTQTEEDFNETRAPKRHNELPAVYHTIRANRKVYSVIIGFFQNKPYEVFVVSGIDNLPENLDDTTDSISGVLVKEGKDWYNFESETFVLREIPDAEYDEKMLSLMISMALRHRTPLKFIIKTLDKTKPIAGSFTHKLVKILSKYVPDGETSGVKCPECGEELRFEGGCTLCPSCGWSRC